jgi:predicted  nucleic acid-binding Zn-ribbon protein
MATMNFVLQGRDELSRHLNSAGNAADRLHRRLAAAATNSGNALNQLARTTSSRMAAMSTSQGAAGEASDALRKSVLSLAPAIIPAAAAMAPLVASTAAAGAAVAAYGAALGPQIAAVNKAVDAEKAHRDAIEESGANSAEAREAQAAYARELAKLPPEARKAAAQLSVLKDTYQEWSTSLAKDTLAPFTKGLALTSSLLPKLTPLVKGTSAELDRMMTLVGGGMASPGFDRLMGKFTEFSTGTIKRANDAIVTFLRKLDTGQVGGGLREFWDYARAQGPTVRDTLRNAADALMNLLRAGSEVGVGLLQAVNAISKLIAAVPAGALAALLQLSIAIKAIALASAGLAAARGLIAAFGAQLVAMRVAAAAAPGPLAAAGAAIMALSRTAKIAIAGTGIGLLAIAISELSQSSDEAPPNVDKLTTSLGDLGRTGKLTGSALAEFGQGFDKLGSQINQVTSPSVAESINNWGASITNGFFDAGEATEKFEATVGSIDTALANLVAGGKADLAAAALARMLGGMKPENADKLRGSLENYDTALANMKFEQELAAASMGVFGAQAQAVQGKLQAQKQAADGLRQSVFALNDAYLQSRGDVRAMESAIDAASEALKKNGRTLDENTAAGRENNAALDAIAATTKAAMLTKYEETGSWEAAIEVYNRGRTELDKSTQGMAKSKAEAKRLADQILATPNKTALLKADKSNLEAKLRDARAELKSVPDARKAQVKANIAQLEQALKRANDKLNAINGKTSTTYVKTVYTYSESGARKQGSHGTQLKAKGGLVHGPGTGTSDSVPIWASAGEFVVRASETRKALPLLRAINEGKLDKQALARGRAATAAPGRPAPTSSAGASARPVIVQNTWHIDGAMDPVAVAKQIQKVLLSLKRMSGTNIDLGIA